MAHEEKLPTNPAEVFRHLIITFLTPMFLASTSGNVAFARLAAIESLNAYGVRTITDLLPIAQVIAFGFAILDSLARSLDQSLSVNLVLRLRQSASSLTRCSETCRKTLEDPRHAEAPAGQPQPEPDAEALAAKHAHLQAGIARAEQLLAAAPSRQPPAPEAIFNTPGIQHPAQSPRTEDDARRAHWAAAMTLAARETAASLDSLPPNERQAAMIRAQSLSSVAQQLMGGKPPA